MYDPSKMDRKDFMRKSSLLTLGAGALTLVPSESMAGKPIQRNEINVFGPREGYTPHIGTLVSMMDWMRMIILYPVQGMDVKDLDYLIDDGANTIGAMLWHLASTERFYQLHTFDGMDWGEWPKEEEEAWGTAMTLGDEGRAKIKGHDLDFYLEKLESVRANTLEEFKKRDDEWLFAVDEDWFWGPTNNYCKWFHVCEHESNHNGVFKFLRSRVPSAKNKKK